MYMYMHVMYMYKYFITLLCITVIKYQGYYEVKIKSIVILKALMNLSQIILNLTFEKWQILCRL